MVIASIGVSVYPTAPSGRLTSVLVARLNNHGLCVESHGRNVHVPTVARQWQAAVSLSIKIKCLAQGLSNPHYPFSAVLSTQTKNVPLTRWLASALY